MPFPIAIDVAFTSCSPFCIYIYLAKFEIRALVRAFMSDLAHPSPAYAIIDDVTHNQEDSGFKPRWMIYVSLYTQIYFLFSMMLPDMIIQRRKTQHPERVTLFQKIILGIPPEILFTIDTIKKNKFHASQGRVIRYVYSLPLSFPPYITALTIR